MVTINARSLRRATATALVTAVVAAAGLALSAPPPAAAAEIYPVPPTGVFEVDGRGFGHGRGMSQYGAQGAASQGASSAGILGAYYPGTTAQAWPSATWLRVVLTREGAEGRRPAGSPSTDRRYECDNTGPFACEFEVLHAAGLYARGGGAGDATPLPSTVEGHPVASWRVRNDSFGLHLEAWAGGAWRPQALDGTTTNFGPVELWGPPTVRLQYEDNSNREYRGILTAVRTSSTTLARVNHVPREDYLRSVVPKEMPSSWRLAALEAQAVAARSYAEHYRRSRPSGSVWDICDSTFCQVYSGYSVTAAGGTRVLQEAASTNTAIANTAGVVRTYGGEPIRAEFSSSNGGWTAAGPAPWLPAQPDGWDGLERTSSGALVNPHHRWSGRLPASALEAAFPAVGRLTAVVVLRRDGNGEWGGRVLDVELRGTAASGAATFVSTTGEAVRSAYAYGSGRTDGIRSSWWSLRVAPQADPVGAWTAPGGVVELAWGTPGGGVATGNWSGGGTIDSVTPVGGGIRNGPGIAGRASGSLEIFARGLDDGLWTNRRAPGGGWLGWAPLGGVLASGPAVSSRGETLHVVVVGADRQLWHRHSPSVGSWSGWEPIGGRATEGTAPAVAQVTATRLDVVVQGTDGAAYRRSYDGGWQGWTNLGGILNGGVGAAGPGGPLVVVGRGADLAGWTRTDTAGWTPLGGLLLGAPTATASLGSGRVDVFGIGMDGSFFVTSRTTGPWSGWRHLT